ncbi:MAG TPA: molybdopterin-binding protein [Gammaproteobacteria bacterium]|nr:molybdopterin-binding protein [Gammaproteobacteria bacterium]
MITGWYGIDTDAPREQRRELPASQRRAFLGWAAVGAGSLLLAGCDRLSRTARVPRVLRSAETLTRDAQHLLGSPLGLAPTYSKADIDPVFRANGTTDPADPGYQALARAGFRDWRLRIHGLVEHPLALTLADLRRLPSQTQITRHDCVEGWSCIGQWTGVRLQVLLDRVSPTHRARYVVFHCADTMAGSGDRYYESLDLREAYHPQTLLAYALNGHTLPVAHGAPVRLRAERMLGYKMAKYVMRIELVESLAGIAGGHGGYWEDRGYAWYAGI